MEAISDDDRVRYSRHLSLPEIGEEGQRKIRDARVLVVGAGGLGSPVLLYLAAAGVGHIGIVEHDRVALSNLQRQVLYETADVGSPKAEAAQQALLDLNPEITVEIFPEKFSEANADRLLQSYTIVADCTDNFPTRFLIHDACYRLKKPLVSAAVIGWEGQLYNFKGYEENQPCYHCLYPEAPPSHLLPTCAESGVLGPLVGMIGAWQAIRVMHMILDPTQPTAEMVRVDGKHGVTKSVIIHKDPHCSFCNRKNS